MRIFKLKTENPQTNNYWKLIFGLLATSVSCAIVWVKPGYIMTLIPSRIDARLTTPIPFLNSSTCKLVLLKIIILQWTNNLERENDK